jgi:hypothetical protein
LPAAGWRLLGTSLEPKGFEFRDASPTAPIAKVVVKTDALSVKELQGRIAVRVRLGDVAWCADAPARTSGTPPSSTGFDHVDKFDAHGLRPRRTCARSTTRRSPRRSSLPELESPSADLSPRQRSAAGRGEAIRQ